MEIGRIDILIEVSLMSNHLALPQEGHLEQVLYIIGYHKIHTKMSLMFDYSHPRIISELFKEYDWFYFYIDAEEGIIINITEARGHKVSIYIFVHTDLEGEKYTRKSKTGVLILTNKAAINCYKSRHATVEASTFGAEFCSTNAGLEMA